MHLPGSSDPWHPLRLRRLGQCHYSAVWAAMQSFTATRMADTPDELWSVEHPPVFTLGQASKIEHLLDPGLIPVVATDRGGQVTYHGPGQVVVYCLLDVRRLGLTVRGLVTTLEQAVITLLAELGINAQARREAPGVYVAAAKVAALGLRIRQGRSYHGLSLNVAMDLAPFTRINPCGYPGLQVTQLRDLGVALAPAVIAERLLRQLGRQLGYAAFTTLEGLPSVAAANALPAHRSASPEASGKL